MNKEFKSCTTSILKKQRQLRESLSSEHIDSIRRALPYDEDELPNSWDFEQGFIAAEKAHGIVSKLSEPKKIIEIQAYRDSNGKPTCSLVWGEKSCKWVGTRRMGTQEVCMATGSILDRDPVGIGYLQPACGCPIWDVKAQD